MPLVSFGVGLILFEGGLTLRFREVREVGRALTRVILIGGMITWALATLAAWFIVPMGFYPALLIGAMLIVTGPTVIAPLLRQIRPVGRVGPIVKWEGIVNDPIGAMLAVLVFEAILIGVTDGTPLFILLGAVKTIAIGCVIGTVGAVALAIPLKRHWVPEYLHNPVAVMIAMSAFALSDLIQRESGLFTVTLMGIILANWRGLDLKHIIEFKENLRVFLISTLFIVLSARIDADTLMQIDLRLVAFLVVLCVVVRPVSIILSTWGTTLTWPERGFISWMAPRGIVAAAVMSIFAEELLNKGFENANQLVTVMFAVVAFTVALYGLTGGIVARRLGLAVRNPQGILFVGAHGWARTIALAVQETGIRVLMADTNRANIRAARMAGLPVHYGNVLAETSHDQIDLKGLGRLVAWTQNNEANSLIALHFAEVFGKSSVYQLAAQHGASPGGGEERPLHLSGRILVDESLTYAELGRRFTSGAVVKATRLTKEFSEASYRERHGEDAIVLAVVRANGTLELASNDRVLTGKPGDHIIGIVAESQVE
jgi:NhaP-type Na+/H+ or K+/H+ antiporter/Trk K+ transport system NAD-binding subunit